MSCSWYQPQTCLGTSRARAWSAAAEPRLQQDVLSSQQSTVLCAGSPCHCCCIPASGRGIWMDAGVLQLLPPLLVGIVSTMLSLIE